MYISVFKIILVSVLNEVTPQSKLVECLYLKQMAAKIVTSSDNVVLRTVHTLNYHTASD